MTPDDAFRAGDLAALSCTNDHPGSKARADVPEILALLLEFGA